MHIRMALSNLFQLIHDCICFDWLEVFRLFNHLLRDDKVLVQRIDFIGGVDGESPQAVLHTQVK